MHAMDLLLACIEQKGASVNLFYQWIESPYVDRFWKFSQLFFCIFISIWDFFLRPKYHHCQQHARPQVLQFCTSHKSGEFSLGNSPYSQ
jgi:hypothetical protein